MSKTSDAIAALAAAETEEEGEVKTLLANFQTLNVEVTNLQAQVAAFQNDPTDMNNADAISATTKRLQDITANIAATLTPAAPPAPPAGGDTTQEAGGAPSTVAAGSGDDTVDAGAGGDSTQAAASGDDSIAAGAGTDTVTGNEGGQTQVS